MPFFMTRFFLFICLLFIGFFGFSQKKSVKILTSEKETILINTEGLDDLIIENSNTEFIEITLTATNASKQFIIDTEKEEGFQIDFQIQMPNNPNAPFRKYITERLTGAAVIARIPKDKSVKIIGENCNVNSGFSGKALSIELLNSIIRLNGLPKETFVRFHAGNFYAVEYAANFDIQTQTGDLVVAEQKQNKVFKTKSKSTHPVVIVRTIKGNIFLSGQ